MIAQCRAQHSGGLRLRIFDDCTTERSTPGGSSASLTELRCTHFQKLRAVAGISEEQYYASMCSKPYSGGKVEVSGKSGSLFLRTHDNTLVLKTIADHEFDVLKDMLPHMVLFLQEHPESLLCRFYGAYRLVVGGSTLRFVVMGNVLPRPAEQVYDLKGTTEDRWVDPVPGSVLKDTNFEPYTLRFGAARRARLVQAMCDDADFLDSVGVMDYSLLVGVSPLKDAAASSSQGGWLCSAGSQEVEVDLQMGIIDFLQRWTPKKVAAHWIKKATIGCLHEIDTEPPAIYRQRFCKHLLRKVLVKGDRPQALQ
jgi:hypothetical protein